MAFSNRQEEGFFENVIDSRIDRSMLVEDAIDWIQSNCDPEVVFSTKELEEWAENNGYTREG